MGHRIVTRRRFRAIGIVLSLASFAVLMAAQPATAHYPLPGGKGGKRCKDVGHRKNSDYISVDIKIRRIKGGCKRARSWLRRDQGDWDHVPKGFRCVRRLGIEADLGHGDYKCKMPKRRFRAIVWATY